MNQIHVPQITREVFRVRECECCGKPMRTYRTNVASIYRKTHRKKRMIWVSNHGVLRGEGPGTNAWLCHGCDVQLFPQLHRKNKEGDDAKA